MSSPGSTEPHWVVRGGIVTPKQLTHGTLEHLAVPGLFGFSVQYQPGYTILELAIAGRFPHAHVSITTIETLIAVAENVGYNLSIVKSKGKGFHHTVEVPHPLPEDLAEVLSTAFRPIPNPARLLRAESD
jgi:hypothetical protein